MNIVVVGGGPAGLYFALLMKKADSAHRITVLERNGPDDTFGWGVVFSDQTLGNFEAADPETCREIADHFARWDDIDIHFHGTVVTSGGHGFSGIARRTLLAILQRRAAGLGVDLRFHHEVRDPDDLEALGDLGGVAFDGGGTLGDGAPGAGRPDLIVAADGVNSVVRRKHAAHFQPDLDVRTAKYVWLGTTRLFDAFTFLFLDRPEGIDGVFQAHAYRFDERHSAFIVECDQASWRAAGFDRLDLDGTVAACERLFAPWLAGEPLLANAPPHQRAAPWQSFTRVRNAHWHHDRTVLIGDAAHTAHFSIGSGTKLAMEDAIALARALGARGCDGGGEVSGDESRGGEPRGGEPRGGEPRAAGLDAALAAYQQERMTEALRLQNAARNSMEWFENVRRYVGLEPQQFAYSLLTRSQRVSHENLRQRDGAYLAGVERWFASRAIQAVGASPAAEIAEPAGSSAANPPLPSEALPAPPAPALPPPPPPMFTPFRLRGLTLVNRVVVSPMDMYCAQDGSPNDFHLVHLGARALGGAGLIVTEMTCVSPAGRITPGCTGMYADAHLAAWRRIVEFVHAWSRARLSLQLGHSGGKGSTRLMWEGMDEPLAAGGWEVMAASPVPYRAGMQVPREMTRADMDEVLAQFLRATHLAVAAGFDMLELHCAHGYLLSGFITPLLNRRRDEYGGALANRLRFPLEVFAAMRAAWPAERPMSVRISATDWVEDGLPGEEAVAVAAAFHQAGADIIHVSAGQTSAAALPVYGRMFQTPFSDRIRNEAGVPTIAVGNITEPDQVNAIVAAGRADLCALARPHLTDPHWTLRAAAELGFAEQPWPVQYLTGKAQLERAIERQNELRGSSTV